MAGRPKHSHKCTNEIIEKSKAYVDGGFMEVDQEVPTIEGLCMYIGKARSTVYDWAARDDCQQFSDILELCNQKQAVMLITGALRNDLNANISKLMLGKQGYKESKETEISGKDGAALGPIILQPVAPREAD